MRLRLLLDMNLSPEWVGELARHGYEAAHWSAVGEPRSADIAIMAWARANGYAIFTHDLDFGTLLALTHAAGPSVLQVRGRNILPEYMGPLVIAALRQYEAALISGALVVIEAKKSRVRVLPL